MNKLKGDNLLTERLSCLSEPVRIRLLRLVEREELSVGELAKVVQLPQSTISRHVKVLSDGQWLRARTEGTSTLLRLIQDDLDPQAQMLWSLVRSQWSGGVEVEEDLRRLSAVLAERRSDTQGFFGRVQGQWDTVRNELFGEVFTFHSLLPLLPKHWVVADLGCGTGNAAELLAPVVKRVIAIDQSEAMLSAARKRLAGLTNLEFVLADLERLPLRDGSVDAAVCSLVLHHMGEPALACREMARILKPGGTCLVIDMVEHDRVAYKQTMGHRWLGFGVPELIRMLSLAGLSDVRFQVLPSSAEAKGPGLFACTATKPLASPTNGPTAGNS
jgi:ubiquinone/menaquinone biosynthesis C-methylase UbiE/DNA-binding transcriptional ArsR family regulator